LCWWEYLYPVCIGENSLYPACIGENSLYPAYWWEFLYPACFAENSLYPACIGGNLFIQFVLVGIPLIQPAWREFSLAGL
jgi:hypothetical protein